jgi:hypothetical protein
MAKKKLAKKTTATKTRTKGKSDRRKTVSKEQNAQPRLTITDYYSTAGDYSYTVGRSESGGNSSIAKLPWYKDFFKLLRFW